MRNYRYQILPSTIFVMCLVYPIIIVLKHSESLGERKHRKQKYDFRSLMCSLCSVDYIQISELLSAKKSSEKWEEFRYYNLVCYLCKMSVVYPSVIWASINNYVGKSLTERKKNELVSLYSV